MLQGDVVRTQERRGDVPEINEQNVRAPTRKECTRLRDDMLVKILHENDHLNDLQETFDTLRSYNMKLNPSKCVFGVIAGKFLGFMVSQRGIEVNSEKVRAILELEPPRTVKAVQSLNGKVAALNRFVSKATDKCLPFFRVLRKSFEWTDEC